VKARVNEWARTERVGAATHVEERAEEGVEVGWLTALACRCECEGKGSVFFMFCALERCGSNTIFPFLVHNLQELESKIHLLKPPQPHV